MITFFYFSEFVNFVKLSLINIKYDVKHLSYSIDSLKTIIQSIEMNAPHTFLLTVYNNMFQISKS